MLCKMTYEKCPTPDMCAPNGGCRSADDVKQYEIMRRIQRLERIVAHLCPDKSRRRISVRGQ